MKIKSVLLPVDFSEAGRPALFRGAEVAQRFDAELRVIHVVLMADSAPLYPVFNMPSDTQRIYDRLTESAQDGLDKLIAELPPDRPRPGVQVLHANFAAPAILSHADEHEIDLIVMGTHGRRGFRHFLLGSVAEEVVRKAACSVMTVRAGLSESGPFERILAAVDLSSYSDRVLKAAQELAQVHGARLEVAHVVPRVYLPVYTEVGTAGTFFEDLAATKENATSALEDLLDKTAGLEPRPEVMVREGHPADELVKIAEERQSDLILMATHGLTGLEHVLLGSVTERVLRKAACPVWIVRRPDRGD